MSSSSVLAAMKCIGSPFKRCLFGALKKAIKFLVKEPGPHHYSLRGSRDEAGANIGCTSPITSFGVATPELLW